MNLQLSKQPQHPYSQICHQLDLSPAFIKTNDFRWNILGKKPMKRAFVLFKCFFHKFTCSMSSHVRTPNIHGTPANSSREYYKFSLWSLSTELERAAVNWYTATCQIISSRVDKACMLCYIKGESNFSVIKELGRNRTYWCYMTPEELKLVVCSRVHTCVWCVKNKRRDGVLSVCKVLYTPQWYLMQ